MYNSVSKFIIWICKKFNREQIEKIILGLTEILKDPKSEIQPKDTFKEDNPNYRNFEVDPKPPIKGVKKKRKKTSKKS